MLILPTPRTTNESISVTIKQRNYEFYFTCNTRNNVTRWYVDISLEGSVFVSGIKILENQFLFLDFIPVEFNHGNIACVRVTDTTDPCNLNNFGFDKDYALVYYTNAELTSSVQ